MRKVWLAQVNNTYGNQAFLPYSVGLLQAYAQTFPEINNHYSFEGFVYLRENIEELVERTRRVDVFGVSCYIWNFNYSCSLAKAVKEANPDCLIVMGGPHVPTQSEGFFTKHPYADILVHYEGEITFLDILLEKLNPNPNYEKISGISINRNGETIKTLGRSRLPNLDDIPSPYLAGVFDHLFTGVLHLHASQETHRGCPYSCVFCDWGSAVFTKVRKFGDERLAEELEWFSEKRIDLLYNCDANFGLFDRDISLARKMAELKRKNGYPNKFRAAYAKNSGERVYQINKILNDVGMSKGATLSFQSMDEDTLTAVKRKNIGIEVYKDLMRKYRAEGIPTYSELIIGLPGETYDSFANGLDTLLNAGAHSSIQCYTCELLPNSEMSRPEYREKYELKTAVVPVLFFHGTPSFDPYPEHYELVVETNTLSSDDWLKCQMISWMVQCFHALGLTQKLAVFVKHYLDVPYRSFYEGLLRFGKASPETHLEKLIKEVENLFKGMLEGRGWGIIDERFGNIIWPPEEGGFLKLMFSEGFFFRWMYQYLTIVLGLDEDISWAVITYQSCVLPKVQWDQSFFRSVPFRFNIHEYLESCYSGSPIPLEYDPETRIRYNFHQNKDYPTLEEFAKEVVWYGRKGGDLFCKVERVSLENTNE